MSFAPIALFCFKRLDHLDRTVQFLKRNSGAAQSPLYVFSDAGRNPKEQAEVAAVRDYLKTIIGFASVEVIQRPDNFGLAKSIISGVSQILEKYDRVIVVEDDLITSRSFLDFLNGALLEYRDRSEIMSISGYQFPFKIPRSYSQQVYLSYRCSSWGWATWSDRWQRADWEVKDYEVFAKDSAAQRNFARGGRDLLDMLAAWRVGKVNSWAIRWAFSHYKSAAFSLFPCETLVQNIGHDGSGTNCAPSEQFTTSFDADRPAPQLSQNLKIDQEIASRFYRFHTPSLLTRIGRRLNFWSR